MRWVRRLVQFAWGYSEMLTIYAGIFVYEWIAKKPVDTVTQWAICAGAFVAISFWNWQKAVSRAEVAEEKREESKRVYADKPGELIAHLSDPSLLTRMQLIPYMDTWIPVEGVVEDRANSLTGDAIHVTLRLERGRRVNLQFDMRERDQLRGVRPGQYLSAICRVVTSFAQPWVSLQDGEVVRLGPALQSVLPRVS